MIDTYLMADSFEALASFCASFRNVIGPSRGRTSFAGEDGSEVPAAGDPSKFYACVRAPFSIPVGDGIGPCDEETGIAVCGRWA